MNEYEAYNETNKFSTLVMTKHSHIIINMTKINTYLKYYRTTKNIATMSHPMVGHMYLLTSQHEYHPNLSILSTIEKSPFYKHFSL